MKTKWIMAVCLLAAFASSAQTNQKPVTVKGTMDIRYGSRLKAGDADVYSLNVRFSDSVFWRGHITNYPIVVDDGMISTTVKRPASLVYAVSCGVINPNNPSQSKEVCKMTGRVPLAMDGTYDFGKSTLKVFVESSGTAQEFRSSYGGTAKGIALHKPSSMLDRAKATASAEVQKLKANAKGVSLVVTNYDFLTLVDHKIAAGPVQRFPEAVVNGRMVYDRDRSAWHFNGTTIVYPVGDVMKRDTLSGSVKWTEEERQGDARNGEYTFNIRVNEPPATEVSVFNTSETSDAAYFEEDPSITSLNGVMKYRDAFVGKKVVASQVAIDLAGNASPDKTKQLTQVQGVNIVKLILFTAIRPFNSE